jgi:hypothetical protein
MRQAVPGNVVDPVCTGAFLLQAKDAAAGEEKVGDAYLSKERKDQKDAYRAKEQENQANPHP